MIVYIEGNIGSGKSTICNMLKANGYEVYQEPVEGWIKSGKLKQFYDGHISAFEFQKYIIKSMFDRQKEIEDKDDEVIILERSVWSSILFARVTDMNEAQLNHIEDLVEDLHNEGVRIFIDTDYKACQERIEKRGRGEETNISLDYLKKLQDVHRRELKAAHKVNGNQSINEVFLDTISIIDQQHSMVFGTN